MRISGFQRVSLIDYPGRMSSLVFLAGCNVRCPYCHNVELVLRQYKRLETYTEAQVLKKLKDGLKFVDAVQITGGEPTINPELPSFIRKCKRLKLSVKLDTNGSNPEMLRKLLHDKLLDYVAMDVKAPLSAERYARSIGVSCSAAMFDNINESIDLLLHSKIDYEFRTTAVPGLAGPGDMMDIALHIKGANAYYLQQFRPGKTLDPKLGATAPYFTEVLYEVRNNILRQNLVKKCEVRA